MGKCGVKIAPKCEMRCFQSTGHCLAPERISKHNVEETEGSEHIFGGLFKITLS
jgi:hypothetical protein